MRRAPQLVGLLNIEIKIDETGYYSNCNKRGNYKPSEWAVFRILPHNNPIPTCLSYKLNSFSSPCLSGGSYIGGFKYTEMKYGVNSPEALAESDAPEFLTKIYRPFYKVKGMVVNNPVSAGMEELEDKMKDMRKSSMDQLNSI